MVISSILYAVFLISGVLFFLSAAVAMFRFRHVYDRAHAASKCLTGGALSVLIAFLVHNLDAFVALKVALAAFFLLLTNAVASHALIRAAYRQGAAVEELEEDELGRDREQAGREGGR